MAPLPGAERIFRRGVVARDVTELMATVGLEGKPCAGEITREAGEAVARALRRQSGSTHALAVLVVLDDRADGIDFGGIIHIAIARADDVAYRRARVVGGRDWVRLGAVEMGLDCLRRLLMGLPVAERIDFEKV
jgi:nicotinamide-nucleotide amidase